MLINMYLYKISYNPTMSSAMCHCCGAVKEDLQLSDRWYICDCGYENDRDYNAAMNIRDCGTRLLAW